MVRPTSPEMPEGVDWPDKLQLFGEIARGGMGAILKGRDPDLGRELAVKVLLDQHRDRPDLVRRFVEEAQICGQLQHPGIVPVYELGTFADQRPYFSMKLVKGRTLAELLAERASRGNDLPRFLTIYEATCNTMAYAHARGVIHRDLKPSNVMVGYFGEVQVMDWGLAKVLPRGGVVDDATAGRADTPVRNTVIHTSPRDSNSNLSLAGSIMGTPAYMAPEQARGETDRIDERADVFALGSILCEILTGQPAFIGRNSDEIEAAAARADLSAAILRLNACRADVELIHIATACLARSADDRPANAGIIATRVKAYTAGVQDRLLASERERAAAEARAIEERKRRRVTLALAASLLALITLGTGGFAWIERQRGIRASETTAGVTAALDRAALRRGEAEVATSNVVARWDAALAEAKRADDLVRHGESDSALRRRVMAAVETLTRLRAEAEDKARRAETNRALRAALDDIRLRQSDARRDEGHGTVFFDFPSADVRYAAAFHSAGIDVGSPESAEILRGSPIREDLLAAIDNWTRFKPRNDRARSALRALADAADDNDWRRGLRAAIHRKDADALKRLAGPDVTEWQSPSDIVRLAVALRDSGLHDDAEKLLRRAQVAHPNDFWINYELGSCLLDLHRVEGLGFLHASVAIQPESPGARWALALHQRNNHDPEGAIRTFRELQRLVPDDYWVAINLGGVLKDQGDLCGAIGEFRRAVAIDRDHLWGHYCLGDALMRVGKSDEAVVELREAIRIKRDDASSHAALGVALYHRGDFDAAVNELREAIRLQPAEGASYGNLGLALKALGKLDEAIAAHREAVRLEPGMAEAHNNLALALEVAGKNDEALLACREAIRLKPNFARAHNVLGNILNAMGKPDEAVAAYREAIQIKPDFVAARVGLGNALKARGKIGESVEAYRQAIRIKPDSVEAHNNLGLALQAQGKIDEAIAAFHDAIRHRPELAASHINLGAALSEVKHDYEAAILELREAIRLQPDEAVAHLNLAIALKARGSLDEAIAASRDAIRLKPDFPDALLFLGSALREHGQANEAISVCRQAVHLRPGDARSHLNLGLALVETGSVDEAIVAFREAVRLQPEFADALYQLGIHLDWQAKLTEALELLRRSVSLLAPGSPEAADAARRVPNIERKLAIESRFPALLKGTDRPRDTTEAIELGWMCYRRSLYAAAARIWADAIASDSKLCQDRQAQHCYNAACAAALAASGKGVDEPRPDDAAKAGLRRQALGWLNLERATWAKLLDSGANPDRSVVVQSLTHWLNDSDLASVRDPEALAKLPSAELEAWRDLWSGVNDLLHRAQTPRK
jgi:serine/threonine-protein kinase